MSNLTQIERRHRRDRWKDAGFVLIAALLVTLAAVALTPSGAGGSPRHEWKVTVVEGPVEIAQ
jgi:hypothetical protein